MLDPVATPLARPLDVSVVLPTYNEAASLPLVIQRTVDALAAADLRGEVIVVDDASPDGTADVAEALSRELPVRVVRRSGDRGLASAALTGFRASEAAVCVVMDADGSHPVEALGEMVRMVLADKAEVVVGSRRVPGGGSRDWPLLSQLKSRFAAMLALGLTTMTDPTTGFMAVRRSMLEKLPLDPVGWKIALEVVVKAHPVRLAEIPIMFVDRHAGENKQGFDVLGQYLAHLYKLYSFRFPAFVELLKFALVGLLGLFVDLSVVALLKQAAHMDTRLCQVFGFAAAVSFNYAVNRRYSFAHGRSAPLLPSYATYLGTNLIGLVLRVLTIHALVEATALDRGRGYLLLTLIGIGVAGAANFLGAKYLAFAPRHSVREALESLAPPARAIPAGTRAWLVITLAAALLTFANLKPTQPTKEEFVSLTMAQNIRASFEGLVHPSITPGVPVDWRAEALPALGNTPVFPLLLAGFTRVGPRATALLPALVFATFLFACYAAARPLHRGSAGATVLLAGSSPWLIKQFALLEFEPLVATWSAVGFALLVRSEGPRRLLFAGLSGLAIGLGFATKMWLVLPGLSACFAYLVARSYEGGLLERSRWMRASIAFSLGALAGASGHLVFVLCTAPQDLEAWLEWVYLGLFNGRGALGDKLSGRNGTYASAAWDYVRWLLRDHGALLVPCILGLPAFTRRMSVSRRAFSVAVLGALLALVPLSIPAAKAARYMTPVLPFTYALAGFVLVAPEDTPRSQRRVDRMAARVSLAVAACMVIVFFYRTLVSDHLAWVETFAHLAHIGVWSVPSFRVVRSKSVLPCLLPCALTSLAVATLLTLSTPRGLLP